MGHLEGLVQRALGIFAIAEFEGHLTQVEQGRDLVAVRRADLPAEGEVVPEGGAGLLVAPERHLGVAAQHVGIVQAEAVSERFAQLPGGLEQGEGFGELRRFAELEISEQAERLGLEPLGARSPGGGEAAFRRVACGAHLAHEVVKAREGREGAGPREEVGRLRGLVGSLFGEGEGRLEMREHLVDQREVDPQAARLARGAQGEGLFVRGDRSLVLTAHAPEIAQDFEGLRALGGFEARLAERRLE
ncbi:hypothetical protein D3C86_1176490 [compost metagenome]